MKPSTWSRSLAVHGVEVLQPRMVEDSLAGRLVGIGGPLVNGGRLIKAMTGELVWRQCQTLPLSLNDYHHPITHTSYHIILQNVFHEDHHNNIRSPHENMARGHFNSCIDFPQLFIFTQLQLQAWLHRFHLSPVI